MSLLDFGHILKTQNENFETFSLPSSITDISHYFIRQLKVDVDYLLKKYRKNNSSYEKCIFVLPEINVTR